MKKLIYLLLLVYSGIFAQVSTGQEQEFDYGIKNNSTQTVTNPVYLTTTGTDGTQGKVISVMNQNAQTGVTSFDGLAVNADPTKYDIGAGVGYISNPQTGEVKKVTWSAQIAQTTPYLATSVATYVLKDDTGTTVMQNSYPTPTQFRTHIYLGKLAHTTFTTILFAVTEPNRAYHVAGDLHDLVNTFGSLNRSGNAITPNGANLQINVSAGETYREGANFTANTNSPNITSEPAVNATSFRNKFRNGSGGWTAVNTTTVDPNYYDDGSGILQLVPNNKWTIKVVYRFGGTGTIHMDYGQAIYDNLTAADAGISNSVSSDPDTKNFASRIGWIIIQQGTTSLLDATKYKFVPADKIGERAASATGTTTMQGAYNNSVTPQITTNTTGGALAVKRGSAADTDNVLVVQNGTGTDTFTVKGNGDITGGLYNSYTPANDANVAHLTGNETISGVKSFTSAPRFDLGASFKSPSTGYQTINALNNGWALGVGSVSQSLIFNTSTNYAYTFPSATGTIALTSDLSNYVALTGNQSIAGNKTFTGQTAITNSSGGDGIVLTTSSTGRGVRLNSITGSTTDLLQFQRNGVETGKVDYLGNITATSFIKSGATSTDALLAGGGTLANPLSGSLTSGYIPKATGANSLGNSGVSTDGSGAVDINYNNSLSGNLVQWGGTTTAKSILYGNGNGYFSGNVGIGTTNPINKFVVSNSGVNGIEIAPDPTASNGSAIVSFDRGSSLYRPMEYGASKHSFTNGNVLIGTTTDDGVNKLQVNGSGRIYGNGEFTIEGTSGANSTIHLAGSSVGNTKYDINQGVIGVSNGGFSLRDVTNSANRFAISPTGVVGIMNLSGTGTRMVTADASGNLSTTVGYKVYTALLTQSGTSAPTATVLENTIGTGITWSYNATGYYGFNKTGAFPSGKVIVFINGGLGTTSTYGWARGSDDFLEITSVDNNTTPNNSLINNASIEIRVYN